MITQCLVIIKTVSKWTLYVQGFDIFSSNEPLQLGKKWSDIGFRQVQTAIERNIRSLIFDYV